MVVTGTSSVTTFGTHTFLQTVRVIMTGAPLPPLATIPADDPPQPQPVDTAGAAQPQAGAGAAHPQPEEAAGAPQPDDAATPQPLTGTSSVTVW